ncbi:hypothetical protein B9J90_15540 [Vibrio sp. V09_P4A23P171]|nr:hypothetical protein B9J90_15540 [Vibrio sp. V09_P4A23P171]
MRGFVAFGSGKFSLPKRRGFASFTIWLFTDHIKGLAVMRGFVAFGSGKFSLPKRKGFASFTIWLFHCSPFSEQIQLLKIAVNIPR